MGVDQQVAGPLGVSDEKPNTRPLNSFFAFRCTYSKFFKLVVLTSASAYYTAIFSVIPQKERSGLLRQLWRAPDPFQAKWALIAKAYSIIRTQQGKTLSNVRDFLELAARFMGIIKPEHYLAELGFVLYAPTETQGYTIEKENDALFDKSLVGSDMSVLDIVKHAIQQGYVRMNLDQVLEQALSHVMLVSQPGNGKSTIICASKFTYQKQARQRSGTMKPPASSEFRTSTKSWT